MNKKKKKMKKNLYKKKEKSGSNKSDFSLTSKKEIEKLKAAYKKRELNFDPDEIAKAILEDKHFRRGFTKK